MAEIKVVAGNCGKGKGLYQTGLFTSPDGSERSVETLLSVEVHGDVAGARNWGGQVLEGLKGGLALASNIDLSGTALLAVSALAPVSADEPQKQALLELTFEDGALLIALADARLPALIDNDREVLRRGLVRAAQRLAPPATLAAPSESTILVSATEAAQTATEAVHAVAGAAGASISSAFGFVRRTVGYERG